MRKYVVCRGVEYYVLRKMHGLYFCLRFQTNHEILSLATMTKKSLREYALEVSDEEPWWLTKEMLDENAERLIGGY